MSKFAEKKAELLAAHGENSKKVFNAQDFNVLGTALLNDPDYEAVLSVKKNGETTTKTTTPVKDFRKAVIGGVLKVAGHDTAEQTSITENYEFPTLPLYPVVSEMVENYMSIGKPFTLQKKSDMQASIYIEPQADQAKGQGGSCVPIDACFNDGCHCHSDVSVRCSYVQRNAFFVGGRTRRYYVSGI